MDAGAARRVDSWKDIATYLKRGTRTVQRWEREEGLPVHRLLHGKLGSVYAYEHELDEWWAGRRPELESQAAAPAGATVAVLPFTDMSQERDQAYFCDGIAEELILALSRLRGLRLISRMSSFRYRGAECDVRVIGRQLRAETLLTGSVRRAGGRMRIAVQLTDPESGYQMWSGQFDREVGDVFAVQEEIARSVAQALAVTLSPGETEALERPPTRDLQAYDYYLRGRGFYYRYGPSDMPNAVQMFTRAVERDPAYAPAYAGLADCWSYLYLYSHRSEEISRKAEEASRHAVELAPGSAQAQASRGLALSLNRRDAEAEAAFLAALRLDGDLFEARYFYARHCFVMGRAEESAALYEDAMRLRPDDYQSPLLVAQIYDDLGRKAEARAARQRGIALAEEHLGLSPDDARAVYMAANGMAALGDRERGREWAERAYRMRPTDSMVLYNLGCVYALLGDVEEALGALEEAAAHGLRQKGWFEHDSNLDLLRGEERFVRLVAGM
jgi:TolB-like protein/cytochrome c-type biogenesis protein CcmH/NrfG